MGGWVGAHVKLGGRAQRWGMERPVCCLHHSTVETVKCREKYCGTKANTNSEGEAQRQKSKNPFP